MTEVKNVTAAVETEIVAWLARFLEPNGFVGSLGSDELCTDDFACRTDANAVTQVQPHQRVVHQHQ